MKKNEIEIAKKTLKLLKVKVWQNIKLQEIVLSKNKNSFKSKNDLIKNINRYVDYLLKKESNSIEKSSHKDMLFEVIMLRFDVLQQYRKSFIMLFDSFKNKPQKTLIFIPSFLESMILIANLANIKMKGIRGNLIIKGIFVIYVATYFKWMNDSSASLEKTMTTLDNYLTNVDKLSFVF